MEPSQAGNFDLTLAFDFGATCSQVAYCNLKWLDVLRKREVMVISGYPGEPKSEAGPSLKGVRSAVSYPKQGRAARNLAIANNEYAESVPDEMDYGYSWGYSVDQPTEEGLESPQYHRVQEKKILLDGDERKETRDMKNRLRQEAIRPLLVDGIIDKEEDVIRHLLVPVLAHAAAVLDKDEGLTHEWEVGYIITYPARFDSYKLEKIMLEALRQTRLPPSPTTGRYNIFAVSEPEAAAHYAAPRASNLAPGDVVAILDLGGLTGDMITLGIKRINPLRFGEKIVDAEGDICGSSTVNSTFRKFVLERLKSVGYENPEDKSISEVVDEHIMPEFENRVKKEVTLRVDQAVKMIVVPNLKADRRTTWARDGRMYIFLPDTEIVFKPTLDRIEGLVKTHLQQSKEEGTSVTFLLTVGGFADSAAVQNHLQCIIDKFNNDHGTTTSILQPRYQIANGSFAIKAAAPAVAIGAIERSNDKRWGPSKYPRRHIMACRNFPYQPREARRERTREEYRRLIKYPPTRGTDGQKYWKNRMYTLIAKVDEGDSTGSELPENFRHPYVSQHMFEVSLSDFEDPNVSWECSEDIWECSNLLPNYIHKVDAMIGGAARLGRITWNVDRLVREHWNKRRDRTRASAIVYLNFTIEVMQVDRELRFLAVNGDETQEGSQKVV